MRRFTLTLSLLLALALSVSVSHAPAAAAAGGSTATYVGSAGFGVLTVVADEGATYQVFTMFPDGSGFFTAGGVITSTGSTAVMVPAAAPGVFYSVRVVDAAGAHWLVVQPNDDHLWGWA
jgi:hypothetical protein